MFFLNINIYIISLVISVITLSLLVIYSKNPIHSILFLVLTYFYTIMLFFYFGIEYISFLILIVYIGALSVLFLFVIMMLNLRIIEIYTDLFISVIILIFFGLSFVILNIILFYIDLEYTNYDLYKDTNLIVFDNETDIVLLAQVIYNYTTDFFLVSTLLLFAVLIGSISIATETNNEEIWKENPITINHITFWQL